MTSPKSQASKRPAEIVREYGPFDEANNVGGVSFDGQRIWAATGPALVAIDPASGEQTRRIERSADAGTAFDGKHLWQIAEQRIDKIEPATGRVLGSIPAPGKGGDSGLTWAEGSLWVGQHRDRRIHQIDPADGAVLERLEMPPGTGVSGLESDGGDLFYCGGGRSGKVRAVRRPAKLPP